MEIELNQAYYN